IPAELLDPVATAPPTRLDDAIRACIVRALRATRGRIYGAGGAAEILGLPPSTLQSKMVKLGVSRDPYVC
ncbi:MAG: AAA family ATPase, partial [Proteobacteria bacterium]